MKLLQFGAPGAERAALLEPDGTLRDLSGVCERLDGAALSDLERLRRLPARDLPPVSGSPRIGPCVSRPGKFVCIGLNYADHARETGLPIPDEPVVFMKATSAICGPYDDLIIPRNSSKTDWEVELGIVIGREARYIPPDRAAEHIAGYCVINDVSERAFQLERGGQWVKGKSCDRFGPVGPWLVTPDEIADPAALHIWLEVDGRRYQDGSTATMIFRPPYLVSYLSQFMSLQPGDIIATGTPPGVGLGQKPPVFLRPGQRLRLGIDGLGEQRQTTVAWAP